MKRESFFLTFLFICISVIAEGKRIEGKILTEKGVRDVTFRIPLHFFSKDPDYVQLQKKVSYFDSDGRREVLWPSMASEIHFVHRGEPIRMMSRVNTLELLLIFEHERNIFLRLEEDGSMKLFRYYYRENVKRAGSTSFTDEDEFVHDRYILQKGDGILKAPSVLNFRKDMTAYFEDCPELLSMIEDKEYKRRDLVSMVRFYNRN